MFPFIVRTVTSLVPRGAPVCRARREKRQTRSRRIRAVRFCSRLLATSRCAYAKRSRRSGNSKHELLQARFVGFYSMSSLISSIYPRVFIQWWIYRYYSWFFDLSVDYFDLFANFEDSHQLFHHVSEFFRAFYPFIDWFCRFSSEFVTYSSIWIIDFALFIDFVYCYRFFYWWVDLMWAEYAGLWQLFSDFIDCFQLSPNLSYVSTAAHTRIFFRLCGLVEALGCCVFNVGTVCMFWRAQRVYLAILSTFKL